MTSKLVPAHPDEVMVISDILPGVTTLSVPFLRGGMIRFGGRATIIKLRSGSLAVFSPVALTPKVQAKLTSLGGPVSYLIAPDLEHHIFLSTWSAAFPSAHIIAPEGLAEKRAKQNGKDKSVTNISFASIFTQDNASVSAKQRLSITKEFDDEFEFEYVDTHPNKELVFFHKDSKTLVEADLLFNLPAVEQYSRGGEPGSAWATKLANGLMSTKGEAKWQRRVMWYLFSAGDRDRFNAGVRRINSWGFENIVPCHGDVILGRGKAVWENVFKWHLVGK